MLLAILLFLSFLSIFTPVNQFNFSIQMFDKRSPAFHPVTIVAIFDAANITNFSMMDVSTNYTVILLAACFLRNRFFKGGDVTDRLFDLVFQILR